MLDRDLAKRLLDVNEMSLHFLRNYAGILPEYNEFENPTHPDASCRILIWN